MIKMFLINKLKKMNDFFFNYRKCFLFYDKLFGLIFNGYL